MSLVSKSLLASAAVLFASSMPVFSQQLAEEVIEEYFGDIRNSGATVEPGTKTVSGQSVEWADVVITGPNGETKLIMPFMRATEIGGGKISMSYSEKQMVRMVPANGKGSPVDVIVSMKDVKHIISGTAAARQHDFQAGTLAYDLKAEDSNFTMHIALNNIKGLQVNTGEFVRHYAGNMAVAKVVFDYAFADESGGMSAKGSYTDLAVSFDVDGASKEQMQEYLEGKRGVVVNYTMGAVTSVTDITQQDFKGVLTTTGESAQGMISLQDGLFKMQGGGKNASYEMKFTEAPLPPFSAQIDSVEVGFDMPLKKADQPMPARILINMTGVKASDTLWGMVDPTGSLPRDKATLNIDLSANMKWLVDVVNADKAQDVPMEVQDVTVNDITLDIAGARLNGKGSAVLDNTKMPPEPVGVVDLELVGGLGLLDKLVALGLVPQDQGQMVKMFSGMFAVPVGEDHLTSKIEMKTGGSIFVNGNQVK
jgi:hypothetical protein